MLSVWTRRDLAPGLRAARQWCVPRPRIARKFEDITGRRLGFGLGVPLRLVAFREGAVSLQLHIEPGLRGYWTGGREGANDTFYVLRAPVGATLGLQATSGLRLAASLELQASLLHKASPTRACSCGWNFLVGPQLGSAIEYTAGPDILVGLDVRAGLEGETTRGTTRLALSAQLVIGYRPSAGSEEQPGFFWPERNRSLLLVGSGAVLGAAGGLGLLYSYKEARDYLAGQSSGTQTVTRAEARAVQIIQPASWAAVGLGAVLLGWGVYRLETAVEPVASVSPVPGGALVSLGGAFQ